MANIIDLYVIVRESIHMMWMLLAKVANASPWLAAFLVFCTFAPSIGALLKRRHC